MFTPHGDIPNRLKFRPDDNILIELGQDKIIRFGKLISVVQKSTF